MIRPSAPRLLPFLVVFLAAAASAAPLGVALRGGDSVASWIQPVGDEDPYTTEALSGSTLSVTLTPGKRSGFLPLLTVLDPSGTAIPLDRYVKSKNGKTVLKKLPIAMTGIHRLVVSGEPGSEGPYLLKTKLVPPKKWKQKEIPLAPGETFDVLIPGFTQFDATMTIKDREGGGFQVLSVTDSAGSEIAGAVDAFVRKKTAAKGKLNLHGPTGDYVIRIGGATAATNLDVSWKAKHPKWKKRKLTISADEPVVTGLAPEQAQVGNSIAITGRNFAPNLVKVWFGDIASPLVTPVSSTDMWANVPEGDGQVFIWVVNPDGQFARSPVPFTWIEPAPAQTSIAPYLGPDTGGTTIDVYGQHLGHVTEIRLGGAVISSGPEIIDDNHLRFVTDAHSPGAATLVLTDEYGQEHQMVDAFTFFGPAVIESVSPTSGTVKGGTKVLVTGQQFVTGDRLFLDDLEMTDVVLMRTGQLQFTTPIRDAGRVDLRIVDLWGREMTLSDAYEFTEATFTEMSESGIPTSGEEIMVGGGTLALGDAEGDGDLDIFLGRTNGSAQGGFLQMLLNDGKGTFSLGKMPAPPGNGDDWEAADIAVGDVDKDGDTDLVLTSMTRFTGTTVSYFVGKVPHVAHNPPYPSTRVLLNDGKGNFALKKDALPNPRIAGTDLFMGTAIELGDIDKDKDLDMIITSPKSVGESTYTAKVLASFVHRYFAVTYLNNRPATRVLLNDGKGAFTDYTGKLIPVVGDGDMFAGDAVIIGDVDGDIDLDLIVTGDDSALRSSTAPESVKGSKTRVLLNDGYASFTNGTATFMPATKDGDDWGGRGLFMGDLDGDGQKDDLFLTVGHSLATEAGKWLSSSRVFTGSAKGFAEATADWLPHVSVDGSGDLHLGAAILFGDVSGNGKPDVLLLHDGTVTVANEQASSLRWFRMIGELPMGNVTASQIPDPTNGGDYFLGEDLALGDIDGDGDLDLVITTQQDEYLKEGKRATRIFTVD